MPVSEKSAGAELLTDISENYAQDSKPVNETPNPLEPTEICP